METLLLAQLQVSIWSVKKDKVHHCMGCMSFPFHMLNVLVSKACFSAAWLSNQMQSAGRSTRTDADATYRESELLQTLYGKAPSFTVHSWMMVFARLLPRLSPKLRARSLIVIML